jgi:hypothetical protein
MPYKHQVVGPSPTSPINVNPVGYYKQMNFTTPAATSYKGPQMIKVTPQQLYNSLENNVTDAYDIQQIVVASGMSEDHLGGDDIVNLVKDVLEAQKNGYAIYSWYGPDTEVLIIGYRPDELTIRG